MHRTEITDIDGGSDLDDWAFLKHVSKLQSFVFNSIKNLSWDLVALLIANYGPYWTILNVLELKIKRKVLELFAGEGFPSSDVRGYDFVIRIQTSKDVCALTCLAFIKDALCESDEFTLARECSTVEAAALIKFHR